MDSWKQYIYAVILCVCICSVITQMISDSRQKSLIRMICGVILAITVLHPLSRLGWEDLLSSYDWDPDSAQYWIDRGEDLAWETAAEVIKSSCETYILEKAELLGADIDVQISLNKDQIPVSAVITGKFGSDQQRQLQNILTTDLGLPKENQTWTWNQENLDS